MNESPSPTLETPPPEDALRPHTYDGIQEYDKRLPNWWLFTLYGAIVFSIGYWAYYHWTDHLEPGWVRVQRQIEEVKLAALSHGEPPNDRQLWEFSRDPQIVAAGRETYLSTCAACHGEDMTGGIGLNLVDASWVHGGQPMEIFRTVNEGVTDKGMPSWGPLLGQRRIAEVVAYLISQNPSIPEPPQ